MSRDFTHIYDRLRTADCALAMVKGGSTQLAHMREAIGSLLVAMHGIAALLEQLEPAPNPNAPLQPPAGGATPPPRPRKRKA